MVIDITGKIIVVDASPSAALGLRFGVVTLGFLAYVLIRGATVISRWVFRTSLPASCSMDYI